MTARHLTRSWAWGRCCRSLLPLVLASGLVSSCGQPGDRDSGSDAREQPNILIIVLDSCRTDKLGCYGYERPTSPNIDAIAADPDAVRFDRHYVQAPWTKPSTASLFTGLYAHQHGVVAGHEAVPASPDQRAYSTQVLPEELVTMPEYFSSLGYFTFAVHNMVHIHERYGFAQGFDSWNFLPRTTDQRQIREATSLAAEAPTRFFGYVHLRACHNPYLEPERDPEYMEAYGFEYDETSRQAQGVNFAGAAVRHAIRDGDLTLDPADQRFLHLVYEAKLRTVDQAAVGTLVSALKASGQYDDTLLIITADHGEELYDHRSYGHMNLLWEDVVRVPLIVKFPRGRKPAAMEKEISAITRSVDLLPALLAYVGAPIPEFLPGEPVFDEQFADFALSEFGSEVKRWTVVKSDVKLIELDGESLLFNLLEDPDERRNLAMENPERVEELASLTADVFEQTEGMELPTAPSIETVMDEATLEDLRSLGYVR